MRIVSRLAPRLSLADVGRGILREAAIAPGLVAVVVALIGAFYAPLTPELQGLIDGVAVALAGAVTALLVRDDRTLPAMVALIHAGFELSLGLGLQVSTGRQAAVMAAVTGLTAAWLRTQLYAKVGPPVPPVDNPTPAYVPAATNSAPGAYLNVAPIYETASFPAVRGVDDTQALAPVTSLRFPEYRDVNA